MRSDIERVDAPEAAAPTSAPAPIVLTAPQTAVSTQAWFDLNGDGRIQDWPVLYGGDAYISSSVPGVATGPVARPAGREVAHPGHATHPHTSAESGVSHPTAATSRHAIASYAQHSTLEVAAPVARPAAPVAKVASHGASTEHAAKVA